ncbi:FG-GAP-like repeat-containing protein [Ferrimonas pelagia]|uniref:VCBS repeat-containing protein n=1 Tax=Ferrimonas pelagia TaxID=1177826 RepID=A0ABP9F0N3_9GAMM
MNRKLLALLMAASLAACGGSSDDSSGDGDSTDTGGDGGNTQVGFTTLPSVEGYPVVWAIESADLNGDDWNDLILLRVADENGRDAYFQVLINDKEQGFTDNTSDYFDDATLPFAPQTFHLVDLTGNDKVDIVPVNSTHKDSPLFIQSETNRFIKSNNFDFAPLYQHDISTVNAWRILPGNVNSDGQLDLIMSIETWDPVAEIMNPYWVAMINQGNIDGMPHFVAEHWPVIFEDDTTMPYFFSGTSVDITGNGLSDIVYGGPAWQDGWVDQTVPLRILENQSGAWLDRPLTQGYGLVHMRDIVTADFNGNDWADIAAISHGYDQQPFPLDRNWILTNQTGTLMAEQTNEAVASQTGFTHSLATGDHSGNGAPDLLLVDPIANKPLRLLENNGQGQFSASNLDKPSDYKGGHFWLASQIVDLDNNGYGDIVLGGVQTENTDSIVIWAR